MIILNFAHPLTSTHLARIAELAGQPIDRVIDIPAQFDAAKPFRAQLRTAAHQSH